MSASVSSLEDGPEVLVLGVSIRPLVTHDRGAALEIGHLRLPAGAGPPPHHHPWEEVCVVLEGRLEVNVDGDTWVLSTGGAVHVPSRTVHTLRAVTETSALLVTTRGSASRFLAACSAEPPADLPGLVRVATRHDIQILA